MLCYTVTKVARKIRNCRLKAELVYFLPRRTEEYGSCHTRTIKNDITRYFHIITTYKLILTMYFLSCYNVRLNSFFITACPFHPLVMGRGYHPKAGYTLDTSPDHYMVVRNNHSHSHSLKLTLISFCVIIW